MTECFEQVDAQKEEVQNLPKLCRRRVSPSVMLTPNQVPLTSEKDVNRHAQTLHRVPVNRQVGMTLQKMWRRTVWQTQTLPQNQFIRQGLTHQYQFIKGK